MHQNSEDKAKENSPYQQLSLDFSAVIRSGHVLSREEVIAKSRHDSREDLYSPIEQTADYMTRAVKFEEAWETTLRKAREALLEKDARELYLEFLIDLKE